MTALRLTYLEGQSFTASAFTIVSGASLVQPNQVFKAGKRAEVTDESGQIARLSSSAELTIIDSPYGLRPEYYGEVAFIGVTPMGPKYRTSCWFAAYAGTADVLIKPSSTPNQDEYLVFRGAIVITEFDVNGRPYGICFVNEGEKLVLEFDDSKSGTDRYSVVSRGAISNTENNNFISQYLDSRAWR